MLMAQSIQIHLTNGLGHMFLVFLLFLVYSRYVVVGGPPACPRAHVM